MAVLLDGKTLAAEIRAEIRLQVQAGIDRCGIVPHLAVILIGEDPASQSYVRGKENACQKAGIRSTVFRESETISEDEVLKIIDQLNADPNVHGILLQLPIPRHLNAERIISRIDVRKDVDGFTPDNVAALASGRPDMVPCTPLGVLRLLEKYQIEIQGKHCVVVGRSSIVGKPMAWLFLKENGTVTICHSKTTDLPSITRQADILVVAVGQPGMISSEHVKEGAVVIDVGISKINDEIRGDVEFDVVFPRASHITPVPGGVGPMTIACLLENTLKCYRRLTEDVR
jgi:methylenetetrahydrofolate dehydrogenase (NADP+)/methenyltetrahydrofolate cyclohydrolase